MIAKDLVNNSELIPCYNLIPKEVSPYDIAEMMKHLSNIAGKMGEVQEAEEAWNDFLREPTGKNFQHFIEEIADVETIAKTIRMASSRMYEKENPGVNASRLVATHVNTKNAIRGYIS